MPTPSGIFSDQTLDPQINGLTAAAAGTTSVSAIVNVHNPTWTAQLKAVCAAATGAWKIEVSNDAVDWNDVTASTSWSSPIVQPTGLTGTNFNPIACLSTSPFAGFNFIRVTFTCTVGSAVITVTVRSTPEGGA